MISSRLSFSRWKRTESNVAAVAGMKRTWRRSRQLALWSAALLGSLALRAQETLPPDLNLFSGETPKPHEENDDGSHDHAVAPLLRGLGFVPAEKPARGFEHRLIFSDGRQLRGEIVALNQAEVVWRRREATEPLRFPRSHVRRILLKNGPRETPGDYVDAGEVRALKHLAVPGAGKAAPEPQTRATAKLPGGDWLFGEVESEDAQTFAVKLASGAMFDIPRTKLEWLYLNEARVPAFGFSGSALDMEGWSADSASGRVTVNAGVMELHGANSISRHIAPPRRFEIAFEIPTESEEGTRIWLQPGPMGPNCYTQGTIDLRLGPQELTRCIYFKEFSHQKTAIPKNAAGPGKSVHYRILYDGVLQRVIVQRNGQQLGDWKFIEEEDRDGEKEEPTFSVRYICLQAPEESPRGVLRLHRLSVRPWDGDAAPRPAATFGDRLSGQSDAPKAGKLEALTAREIVFSGETKPRTNGTFIRLEGAPRGLSTADAMLIFGKSGELQVSGLAIEDGKARCQTAFADVVEIPIATLETIVFPLDGEREREASDLIVFQNGDELSGSLLGAAAGERLRWQTATGQQLEFQPAHIAGVCFARSKMARPPRKGVTLELRNGDRLRGQLSAFGAEALQFKTEHLDLFTIPRELVWKVYPGASSRVCDGGLHPAAWLNEHAGRENKQQQQVGPRESTGSARWVYLDGNYVLRGWENRDFSGEMATLRPPWKGGIDRMEIRCEATDFGGSNPSLGLELGAKVGGPSIHARFGFGDLELMFNIPRRGRGPHWRQIPINGHADQPTPRIAVRIFVDSVAGTADFYLNGEKIGRVGQLENERLPGLGRVIKFQSSPNGASPVVLSNLWIGPWNGELPQPGRDEVATTALANGDVAMGVPTALRDGTYRIETDIGQLELPEEKVNAIEFGGPMAPKKHAARVRMTNGCALNLESFTFDGDSLSARSDILGELRLPASVVTELVFNPAPVRPPHPTVERKLAKKFAPEADAEPDGDEPEAETGEPIDQPSFP